MSIKTNLSAAVLSHLIRYGAPLLAYPILTRNLGSNGFAEFSLILAVSLILSQFIEFGFGLMGVREIAQNKDENAKTAVGEIVFGRILTFICSLAIYLVALPFIPIEEIKSPEAVFSAVFLSTAYGFSSSWYYISVERTPALALQDTASAICTLLLILLFVHDGSPGWLAALAFALPLWIALIYGHYRAITHLGISTPNFKELRRAFLTSTRFFVLTGTSSIVNRMSVVFLGALSTPSQVAFYAAGERLITAAINATLPFIRVLVPRISKLVIEDGNQAKKLYKMSVVAIAAGFSLIALAAAVVSPWFVPFFFGLGMAGAVPVIIAQMLILPASTTNRAAGMLGLVPLQEERIYQQLTLLSAAVSLVLVPIAAISGGAMAVGFARAAVEGLLAVACLVAVNKVSGNWSRVAKLRRETGTK